MRSRSLLLILLTAGSPLACESTQSTPPSDLVLEEEWVSAYLREAEEEQELLAIKYGLETAAVASVVRGYLMEHDAFLRLLVLQAPSVEQAPPQASVRETVQALGQAHGIEPSVVAAILIDYQLARALRGSGGLDGGR